MRCVCRYLVALILAASIQLAAAQPGSWKGHKLGDYLDALNEQGLKIIYTSDLVHDDMVLANEPDPQNPSDGLAAVLRPFDLTAVPGPAGRLLISQLAAPPEAPSPATQRAIDLPIPEVVVTSSLHRLEYSRSETHTYLDSELATRIPTTADETVRLTHRLPGTASNTISSRNHVRGGEVNEVLFTLDGLRLYEPYHLKDFQSIATIVNSSAIGGMDFFTGAYPARYGDRMSGVLSIELRQPEKSIETELALSFFNTSALSLGTFGNEGQGDWLVSARRGNLDIIFDLVDPDEGSPDYRDFLAHIGWEFGPRARISANVLVSDDKLTLREAARGETADADYSNQVFWLKWQAEWLSTLRSETLVSVSDITNTRNGELVLPGIVSGTLSEFSEFLAVELSQHWDWVASDRWMLKFGMNAKDLHAKYRFDSTKVVAAPFDEILDNRPITILGFDESPEGKQHAAYAEIRLRLINRLTADVGLRWDQQTYTTAADDRQYSPRVSVLYEPSEKTDVRLGWGQFYQAQEINELQLSDGIANFFPAQRAEHFVLNVKHAFSGGVDLDLSVYRKSYRTVRPRFENSFDSLTLLPELQFDRVRVDSAGAEAIGAELMLTSGSVNEDLLWWLGYGWSEIKDEIQYGEIPRNWDQTHSVKAGLSWRWGAWNFSAAGEAHTGWPKTLLMGENVMNADGTEELVLTTTDRNTLRYSVFQSLDVRVSRQFDVSRGELMAFLEVTNVYDRANPCCTRYALSPDGSLGSQTENWLPLVPSLGVVWRF